MPDAPAGDEEGADSSAIECVLLGYFSLDPPLPSAQLFIFDAYASEMKILIQIC